MRMGTERLEVVVVGGGADGLELAFNLHERWRKAFRKGAKITFITSGKDLLDEKGNKAIAEVEKMLRGREIKWYTEMNVTQVEKDCVYAIKKGKTHTFQTQVTFWSTGIAPLDFYQRTTLPEFMGYFLVDSQLTLYGMENVFAAGDCAQLYGPVMDYVQHGKVKTDSDTRENLLNWRPNPPKKGEYSAAAGEVLGKNIYQYLTHGKLNGWKPKKDPMLTIGLGNRLAIGTKMGVVSMGEMAWKTKNHYNKMFVKKFHREQLFKGQVEPSNSKFYWFNFSG
eukprot:TRINITY_DN1217_c0_g1_i4.p1 TRINITY_DN1217_c0_g1~~TRINITY_DN1217_c0_g1_i4.p1  ORF type:complete len:280 (-),score=48.94 TRINITY_DN1217_c0_g1_i4:73-912(-)